ncbi:ACP phosphodiesterase [Geotalea sp. SG265]|uniref:acyl carrier protein phosphodiesterase n=1 Tax=Geotalea sp. SG265 TaxID=2922867 RepID=UPI001FAF61D0|nr:ACP phosphodiesterase [Geotalea sp. SG265]
MNFLAHLALSGENPDILVGNLMGDFVKGRLGGCYPAEVRLGLQLHRKIDRFAEDNRHFIRSRYRLDRRFGLFRGALVDLFYDHFLARNWRLYHAEPLVPFIRHCHGIVETYRQILPEPLAQRLPELFGNWLPSYAEVEGIDGVLKRMSARFSRPNPLAGGADELERHYPVLEDDFLLFYPELQHHVADLLRMG